MTKTNKNGEEELVTYDLSDDEIIALSQIDLMKQEITSIQRHTNQENTAHTYALSKEKEHKMHDDRFYVAIMLAHRLYELRRGKIIAEHKKQVSIVDTIQFKKPKFNIRR